MRHKSTYVVSTNFTNGVGCAVLARSWRQALDEATKGRPVLAMFRNTRPDRTDWGWRFTRGSVVLSIALRARKVCTSCAA
jgi:hypothetical protein